MRKKKIIEFSTFRNNYKLDYKPLEKRENCIFYNGELVEDVDKKYPEGKTFFNIGYGFKNSIARPLSNLFPMQFKFRGKKVNSIEGVLQGIKYKSKKIQNLVFKYYGLDAFHTRQANNFDFWGQDGKLYWQGKEILRNSEEYQLFLDELYLSVVKNPLYKKLLLSTGDKYLLHHIGKENPNETVLTRFEFEQRLNSLREFCKEKGK